MLARQSKLKLKINDVNVDESVGKYISSWSYTDNLDKLDELSLKFNGENFIKDWTFRKGEKLEATIEVTNWVEENDNRKLNCGTFTVDSDNYSGPPDTSTIGAISIDISKNMKNETKYKEWENISLEELAKEKAEVHNMNLIYDAEEIKFERVEQNKESDLKFLSRLAEDNSIQMKMINNFFVFFQEKDYEKKAPLFVFDRNKGLSSYSFTSNDVDTYDKCILSYMDSRFGKKIKGEYTAPMRKDYKIQPNRILEDNISGDVVGNTVEEKELELNKRAQSYLREKNKNETTGSISLPGDPAYEAGLTARIVNFGKYDGIYIIEQVVHSKDTGYNCSIKLRRTLEY